MEPGRPKWGEVIVISTDRKVLDTLTVELRDDAYTVVAAATPDQGLTAARSASAELAVIDSSVPDALDYARKIREVNSAMGFILVVGEDETDLASEAARRGSYDFITRPIHGRRAANRIRVALEKHSLRIAERAYTVALEERVMNRTEAVLQKREQVRNQFINTIRALERALQAKNLYTEGHSRRVAEKSVELARALDLPKDDLKHIELGALFHDIGKIGIRDEILNKPDRLDREEYHNIKLHPTIAEQILSPLEELRPIVSIVKHEHEWWDGNGYPSGLKGEEIPVGSRIISVADAWDSMVYDRVYRKAMSHEAALAEIESRAGTQFDPRCVEAFCRLERARCEGGNASAPSKGR